MVMTDYGCNRRHGDAVVTWSSIHDDGGSEKWWW